MPAGSADELIVVEISLNNNLFNSLKVKVIKVPKSYIQTLESFKHWEFRKFLYTDMDSKTEVWTFDEQDENNIFWKKKKKNKKTAVLT